MSETLIQTITNINGALNNFIWGPIMLAAFLAVGLMFTIRTGFFQLSKFSYWIEITFLQLFKNKKVL